MYPRPKHKRAKHGEKPWKEWLKIVLTALGVAGGLLVAVLLYLNHIHSLADFDIELRRFSIVRYSDQAVPEAVIECKIANNSTIDHSLSLRSIRFPVFGIEYELKSTTADINLKGGTRENIQIVEKNLFFDTLLALPFDSETVAILLTFVTGNDTSLCRYDSRHVEKCLFMQQPELDPSLVYQPRYRVVFQAFRGDSITEYAFAIGNPTAPFVKLPVSIIDTSMVIDSTVFYPTFGGIYMYNLAGYQPILQRDFTPADIFSDLSEYQISKTVRQYIDFDFERAVEFVYILFSEDPNRDIYYDKKLMNVQYVAAIDTTHNSVLDLKRQLEDDGFRVSLKKVGGLGSLVEHIKQRDGCEALFGPSRLEFLYIWTECLNRALSQNHLVVLDFGKDTEDFKTYLRVRLSQYGFSNHLFIEWPSRSGFNLFRDYFFLETSRVFILDVCDTLIFDELLMDSAGKGYGSVKWISPRASARGIK